MPVAHRKRRKDQLGERIITCNGVKVCPSDYNFSENIGRGKVLCSCGSIVLQDGYLKHTYLKICTDYHAITKTEPIIVSHLP